jgi:hypothetical protein
MAEMYLEDDDRLIFPGEFQGLQYVSYLLMAVRL